MNKNILLFVGAVLVVSVFAILVLSPPTVVADGCSNPFDENNPPSCYIVLNNCILTDDCFDVERCDNFANGNDSASKRFCPSECLLPPNESVWNSTCVIHY